jgi:hypothetical protein
MIAPALLLVAASAHGAGPGPFAQFELPDAWETRFWDDADTKALLKLDPKALAELVPVQAGLRFCRCPGCDADEASDPLIWSATKPQSLTCSRCGQTFPNAKFPEKKDGKIPEEAVEVLPGKIHHYPYHLVAADAQHYADERLYLDAKRDYETRESLAKAALYAAVRFHERKATTKSDPNLARFAAVILLRFAQVYPAYATHYDQPGQPKFLQRGDLAPPYRRGYQTGKWEWTASLDVPLNLVTAYALIRDEPVWDQVGRWLEDPNPKRTIEHGFFRASADFVARQPDEYDEMSLQAYRGLFAVGRLLEDDGILTNARARLALFAERGFFHDGYWRQGNAEAHRRVVRQLDGWIDRLARGAPDPAEVVGLGSSRGLDNLGVRSSLPMIDLIHAADAVALANSTVPEIITASWPSVSQTEPKPRRAALLGGVGIARLSVGSEKDGLDIELRGMGNLGSPHFQRQALRLSVGGRIVLDDLDDLPPARDGWDLATASHNSVVVDGLNQRETPLDAREPAEGGEFLYYAADPDFQVVALDDPRAYPRSTTRYRQVVIAASGKTSRYGVSIFQVHGGLQHDQIFHGPTGSSTRWTTSVPLTVGPESLLPRSIPYVPNTRADDGRWFVQAYGEFRRLVEGKSAEPMTARLNPNGRPGLRLHVLGDRPLFVFSALTPDPTGSGSARDAAEADEGRASLILRHRSTDGATLKSIFVSVFDPIGSGTSLKRVGRVASSPDTIVLYVETADGDEHLVINLKPGTSQSVRLADGRSLTTDGLVARVEPNGLELAGGTQLHLDGQQVRLDRLTGRVVGVGRAVGEGSRGWFEVDGPTDRFLGIEGRTLLIRHGEGPVRGWTIRAVDVTQRGRAKLFVQEEPGFAIDPTSGNARYYQFPRAVEPGPHQYTICRIARTAPPLR